MSKSKLYFHVARRPVPTWMLIPKPMVWKSSSLHIKKLPNKAKTEEPKNLIDGFIWQAQWKPIYGSQQTQLCVREELIF